MRKIPRRGPLAHATPIIDRMAFRVLHAGGRHVADYPLLRATDADVTMAGGRVYPHSPRGS